MCESTAYQYRRDSTYTVPYVPAIAFCANARPRTLGTLPDDASRLMRGVLTQRLVGLRPPPCVVPSRKPIGFRQRTETRKPPSWHTKAHEISRINELQPQKGFFRVISCRALGPCSCPADGAPAGAAVVARLARHRLKPCRGDTAECCRKATRRSQGSWSRAAPPIALTFHK